MRRIIYREIADRLRIDIDEGRFAPGDLLPSESALCASFEVSRVTVRKSLELLREEGLIASRQGLGWIVATPLVAQPLDSLVSIERQLAESGRSVERRVTDFRFVDANEATAAVLGPRVLEVGRLNVLDDLPFSRITIWCREDLAIDLSRSQVAGASFLDLLGTRPARAIQTIAADAVPVAEAELLAVPIGSPALRVRRTTYDANDAALFMSEQWFPGHLTEFVAELSTVAKSDTELRLVSEA